MFSSSSFIVLGLTFKPLIHLELIFVTGKKKEYGFFPSACDYPIYPVPHSEKTDFYEKSLVFK
jgi:hypothetical protein